MDHFQQNQKQPKKKAAALEAAQQEAETQRMKESEQFKELYEKNSKRP